VQLEEELQACREEASLTEHQLNATRDMMNVLRKHVNRNTQQQQQPDTQSVTTLYY